VPDSGNASRPPGEPLVISRLMNAIQRNGRRLLAPSALAVGLLATLPVAAQVVNQSVSRPHNFTRSPAGPLLTGRADLHLDTSTLEINLSISNTEDACQGPLNGEFCLRYSVAIDGYEVEAGYGLVSNAGVTLGAATIRLSADTTSAGFKRLVGQGGTVSVTWAWRAGARSMTARSRVSTLAPASVSGSVFGQNLTGRKTTSSVLLYSR
jgi:hypothetical protein